MFERFTEEAIRVIVLAQRESRRLGHNFVGPEFILVGLIGEDEGIAAKALKSLKLSFNDISIEVEKSLGHGSDFVETEIPFTHEGKRLLEYSWDEARQLGHNYIGSEHLLLGLLRLEKSGVGKILDEFGISLSSIRSTVIRTFGEIGTKIDLTEADRLRRSPKSDEIETVVNYALFEAMVSALPKKAQPIALKWREVVLNQELARRNLEFEKAAALGEEETKLLEQLSKYTNLSLEIHKLGLELEKIKAMKEKAIRDQEYEKTASLREKESELREKLRQLNIKARERWGQC